MSLLTPKGKVHLVVLFVATVALLFAVPRETFAQQATPTPGGRNESSSISGKSVEPFTALERAVATGESRKIRFGLTNLDTRAEATAQAALRGQTLLVRVRADSVPVPAHFNVPRYALWVYIPNYRVKCISEICPSTHL